MKPDSSTGTAPSVPPTPRTRLGDFITLARMDKPIGTWLLLWPTLTALWIAADGFPGWHLFLVFFAGTFLMRSVGCIINDMTDMDIDGQVERTKGRPLATGRIKKWEALLLTAALLLPALLLVLTTNLHTIMLALPALAITCLYPRMKRHIWLPQAVLGLAFSWGILMAFTAVTGELTRLAWLLLLANLFWVVAYDTEYAMVDRDDDLKLGLKSTAILFADLDRLMIGLLQGCFLLTMLLVPLSANLSFWYFCGLAGAAALFAWQQFLIRQRARDDCFKAFLNNHWAGCCVFLGVLADHALPGF